MLLLIAMIDKAFVKRYFFISIIAGAYFLCPFNVKAQSEFKGLENLFTTPLNYVIYHTTIAPVIDGDINDNAWKQAEWTTDFGDIEGDSKPKPTYQTKVKMLWGDSCLYIAAQIQEPNVWAYQAHHDDIVFHDNDFEIFINPNNTTHQYYEIEVNALNTIFDLFLNNPYRDAGKPMISWDAEGLRSAVKVQGTLNKPGDTDQGWTVEMAIPFKALYLGDYLRVPHDGTLWRINFSRVEWDTDVNDGKYIKRKKPGMFEQQPEHNWVWSPQGVINMHFPERWGYLLFSNNSTGNTTFTMPYNEEQRRYLWLIYYRERMYFNEHGTYALTLKEFGLGDKIMVDGKPNQLILEATPHQFMALITDEADHITYTINQEGLIQQLRAHNE
jgi:hypothetical protein